MTSKKPNKRKIGETLENRVLKALGPSFHKTGNSGATFKDGDIRHRKLCIECKVKGGTKGFTAPLKELQKLWKLSEDQGKDWLYIEENANGKTMVLMDFNAFVEYSESYFESLAVMERLKAIREKKSLVCCQYHKEGGERLDCFDGPAKPDWFSDDGH